MRISGRGAVLRTAFKRALWTSGAAPVGAAEAALMLGELKAAPLLNGFRGAPIADVPALAQLIATLAAVGAEENAAVQTTRPVSAAAFRDATGLGRKRAIQLLEFFDRVGYTRRIANAHVVRTDSPWAS